MTDRQLLLNRAKTLAEALLKSNDVTELDLSENGTRIVVRRRTQPATEVADPPAAIPMRRTRPRPRGQAPSSGSAAAPAAAPEPSAAVVAPLTGIFYARPSPSSAPFCQPGETVHPGQLVCIVEAMKVFNEIQSDVGGTVTAVIPKDGQLVQKGDALIRVKPF